ncbi:MAG: hypothetical protein PHR83_03000 [Paludibacter sp.]|nr:hypothetical protein [Paludibacter sp.]
MNFKTQIIVLLLGLCPALSAQQAVLYQSDAYSIFPDRIVQGAFEANVLSPTALSSNYRSPEADRYSPDIQFKFSINSRDNEMISGKDHRVTLVPENGKCTTNVIFGEQLKETKALPAGINLPENTAWTIRLDMRKVFSAFDKTGYYTFYNGDKLTKADFKGVYVAGSIAPLSWDFSNLYNKPDLQLTDPDGDGIYETTLIMNKKQDVKLTEGRWQLTKDLSAFPQYTSGYPVSDAIYKLATEEMIKAVEPDSTFRTGKEWAGVWTRDISYSIILSMAYLQPRVAKYSLLRKVKNNRIIQDTGTGGAYPASTDRIIWAVAAWELYKSTGDKDWLKQAYSIIKNSIDDDLKNVYDPQTGLVKGESSFLDWREETYPRWMQPADIYESECLGTNAVHYQANSVLADIATLLNEPAVAARHRQIAQKIKTGINQQLWLSDKGYYGQFLYGRNFKTVSPRSEALGEALCVWFSITDKEKQQSVISRVPVTDYGISCIYPQIPGIPPYHNNAVWPFVQSYWALASAKAGNEKSVLECIAAVYRPAALFLTNKENFVAGTGDFAGTQINSGNMLWSLSGSLALVQRVLFGIEFGKDSLYFHPFVPQALAGKRSLTNFRYRNAVLDIQLEGYGNRIQSFELDSRVTAAALPATLSGNHSIKIVLTSQPCAPADIHKVPNYTTVETPVVSFGSGVLSWPAVEGAKTYTVLKNGIQLTQTTGTSLKVAAVGYAEYQVLAVDSNRVSSFASEPLVVTGAKVKQVIEVEKYAPKSTLNYRNYQGEGFVEVSKTVNRLVTIPVRVSEPGIYAVSFRYANGNGPVNTENKCAIRTLKADGKISGTIILPQRGTSEWSNWGNTNSVRVKLSKGKHSISVAFESCNENMNGDINQAMLDQMIVSRIR